MKKRRQGMTLIEMIICLTILAVTMVALVKGYSNYVQLTAQGRQEERLVAETEALLMRLEGEAPKAQDGVLMDDWHYTTHWDGHYYSLELWNEAKKKTYELLIREEMP